MLFIPAIAPGPQEFSSAGWMNRWMNEVRLGPIPGASSPVCQAQLCTSATEDDVTEAAVEHRCCKPGI